MEKANDSQKKERVIVYVDGFNLYFGMIEAGFLNCKWLDINLLAKSILMENQELVEVKYFTSRVGNDPEKQKRQSTYLEALETVNVKLFFGHYQRNTIQCRICGSTWLNYSEKMTEVNIATHIMVDAYMDKYDSAVLVSGDSDLVPPIKSIHTNFKNKRVIVAFPPKRHNNSVALAAKGSFTIGRKKILDCQFPMEVHKDNGFVLRKPFEW